MKKSILKFTGERLIPKLNVGQAFYYEHLARYFFASQIVRNKTVLDLGCGSGYGSYILKNIGHSNKVSGVDISPDAINYAQENYGKNIDFQIGNIHHLDNIPDKSIDIAISFEVLEHTDKQDQMLSEIKRVLKNGGTAIISTPNILTYPPGNEYHLKELSPKDFNLLLKKYFKNFKIYFQNFFFSEEIVNPSFNKPVDVLTSEGLFREDSKHLVVKKDIKDSEYLLAVCSDSDLPDLTNFSVSTDQVNNLSLKQGIVPLLQQFSTLNKTISQYQSENSSLTQKITEINKIVSNYQSENQNLTKQIEDINQLVSKYESENQNLTKQIEEVNQQIFIHQNNLKNITSSKYYKIWRLYCKVKNLIKK